MPALNQYISTTQTLTTGTVPRTVAIYTVPSGFSLVLESAELATITTTGSGNMPVFTIGNSGSGTAYEATRLKGTAGYLYSTPQPPQTVAAGTSITATITTNSTYSTHTGIFAVTGYLVALDGSTVNPPSPPTHNSLVGTFYTTDPAGNPVGGVTVSYALASAPAGTGLAYDATPHTVTSDGSGLVSIPITIGATYKLWSALNAPVLVLIPTTATSPYAMPNWVYNV